METVVDGFVSHIDQCETYMKVMCGIICMLEPCSSFGAPALGAAVGNSWELSSAAPQIAAGTSPDSGPLDGRRL